MKNNNLAAVAVETVAYRSVVAEAFRFVAQDGPIAPIPRHAHESYQIGLTLTNPGRYWFGTKAKYALDADIKGCFDHAC